MVQILIFRQLSHQIQIILLQRQNNKVVTGDNSNLIAWGTLLFTALGCSLVAYKSKKRRKVKRITSGNH